LCTRFDLPWFRRVTLAADGTTFSTTPTASSVYADIGTGKGILTQGDPQAGWRSANMTFSSAPGVLYHGGFGATGCAELQLGPAKKKQGLEAALGRVTANKGTPPTGIAMGTGKNSTWMYWLKDDPVGPQPWEGPAAPAPTWAKDLVIYEIAPRVRSRCHNVT
jgi:hypothetical protein